MRLAWLDKFQFQTLNLGNLRYVKRGVILQSQEYKKRHETPYRELMPPFLRYAKAEHVCLLGSIAVTFGTLGKFFDRRGLSRNLRFEVLSLHYSLS